jgi:hypothetical protein
MLVYRVETPSGGGPYGAGGFATDVVGHGSERFEDFSLRLAVAHNDDEHPAPYAEDLTISGNHCGFESLDKLREWFKGWGKALHDYGFRIVEFTVPDADVQRGERQVAFRRRDTDIAGVMSLVGICD